MLVALSLSGCFAQETPDATSSPSPSTTPVFASEEEALAAATEAYENYLKVSDAILADGGAKPERLLEVATSAIYERELEGYAQLASAGLHGAGSSRFDSTRLQQWSSVGSTTSIAFYACVDIGGTDFLDSEGNSHVPLDRVERYPAEITVERTQDRDLVSTDSPWSGENFC